MNIDKRFNLTKDYIDAVVRAWALALSKDKDEIDSDDLFFWVYHFLRERPFSSLFWNYLGIEDTILDNYYKRIYWESIDFVQDNLKDMFEFNDSLRDELSILFWNWHRKLDFISLLYISLVNISTQFRTYLDSLSIDISEIKRKIFNVFVHKGVKKIWTIQFFTILNKVMDVLNIDPEQIDMILEQNKDIQEDNLIFSTWWQEELIDEEDSWDGNVKISSDIKQEEKKLTIEYFGTDLTKEAREWFLDPFIWRQKEIEQLIYTLLRKTKNNPLLIWEAWVGKTAIVEWLAQKVIAWEVSDKLKNKRIFVVDMGSLLAGTKYRWEFEARFKAILDEAADPTNKIILFIDELHTIIWAGNAEGSADAANMLKPLLSRWKIQLIWATTFDEYQKHIEKDPALKRRFQEIVVEEPTRDEAVQIIQWLKEKFEDFHGVNISSEAILASIDLSSRYILNKQLPDKAIDLIDESCARKSTLNERLKQNDDYKVLEKKIDKLQADIEKLIVKQDYFKAAELKEKEEKLKQKMKTMRTQNALPKNLRPDVVVDDIGKVLADKLWIPADQINQSEIQKLKWLDWLLKCTLLWQDDAIDNVVKSIRRNRLSVVKRSKPIASFLFLGPSWVWKTFLAKLLAKDFFWDEKSLIRVDMSEFMEKHSVSKLLGSAPGYVWYEEGWILTEAVRRRPYSVILFDEIEKASNEVLNILLQILDEWHLKDNKWRWIDFKNTIIILTSNIWSEEFGKKMSKIWFSTANDAKSAADINFEQVKEKVLEKVKDFLSPELLNRLDYTMVYRPLSKEILTSIFKNKFQEFVEKWKEKKEIKLPILTQKRIDEIIDEIYNPEFGARPVERYIYDKIEPDLINQILWCSQESAKK